MTIVSSTGNKWWIRHAVEEDMPFICDSWLESYRKSHARGPIPRSLYRTVYREVIKWYLDRDVSTLLAFNPDDEHQCYGWACTERTLGRVPIVHYVYVKSPFRRWGIATELLKASLVDPRKPFVFSFKTPAVTSKLRTWTGARFDPFVVSNETDEKAE